MNPARARTAELRSRHLRLLEKCGIPFPAPGQDCEHPLRGLRYDGIQETRGEHDWMAWVTCTDCGCSFLIPVREDVAEHAGQNGADVGRVHGGARGRGRSEVVMPEDTSPPPAESSNSANHSWRR